MALPASPGRLFLALLAPTTAFPIVASLIPVELVPAWLGVLDVAVAGVFVIVGIWTESSFGREATERDRARAWGLIRTGSGAILVLLALFLLDPNAVNWSVLLVGLAWRAWLVIWALPGVLASLRVTGRR